MSARCWIVLPLCLVGAAAIAQQQPDEAAERERIASERAAAETRFAEERLDCQRRFVVTSCVDAARKRERETLEKLRHQEAVLDDAQRRRRAAERLSAIRARIASEEARRQQVAADAQAQGRHEAELRRHPPRAGKRWNVATPPESAASAPDAAAREARARARFEGRQDAARQHRADAQRRAAERARTGKPQAAPLPVPVGASGAAR